MSTGAYEARSGLFHQYVEDAQYVLSHPELVAPDHPYIDTIKEMAEYATFGVIDPANKRLYGESGIFAGGIVLAPVLQRDLRVGRVAVSSGLSRRWNINEELDLSPLKNCSALCDYGGNNITPIITPAPWLNERSPFLRGITLVHELDHAHWWWKRRSMYRFGSDQDEVGRIEMEVSAYRLEQQILFAHEPELYDQEYGEISVRFADLDFSKLYKPRQKDKLRKAARAVAFVNFMFDELGADVGVEPNEDVILAMKSQQLV